VKRAISEPVSGLNAGLHSVLRLPPGLEEPDVVSRALSHGLAVDGLDGFRAEGVPRAAPALVVGYGTPPPNAYTTAIARLLTVLSGR
jgi:GntR family transcriptional regulator/MocR family aminotransferase